MRNATHTPGPWAVSKRARRRVTANGVVICNAVLRNRGGPKHKADMKDEHEAEANADLIAAAPELLEALEELIPANLCATNLALPDDTVLPVDMTLGEIRRALAAIAKAKGGAL